MNIAGTLGKGTAGWNDTSGSWSWSEISAWSSIYSCSSKGGGDCSHEDFFVALGIVMTFNYWMVLGLLNLARSITGINKESSQYLACLVLWWFLQVIFQVLHWRQVTEISEARYSFHWVYQEHLNVGLTVQQMWMRSQWNQLTISLSYIVEDEECHSVKDAPTYSWHHVMDLCAALKSLLSLTTFYQWDATLHIW